MARERPVHLEKIRDDIKNQKTGSVMANNGNEDDGALPGSAGAGEHISEAKNKLSEIIRDLRFSDDEESMSMSRQESEWKIGQPEEGQSIGKQAEEPRQIKDKQHNRLQKIYREDEKRERNKREMQDFHKRILEQKRSPLTQ